MTVNLDSVPWAAAAYNAGPKRVQDWLDGRAGLPKETEAHVRIITGHSADEWRAAKDLLVLYPSTREPVPCPTIAEGSPKANVRMALAPVKQEFAWGVQLVGSGSEAAARAANKVMQKKYGSLLGLRSRWSFGHPSAGLPPGTGCEWAQPLARAPKDSAQSCAPQGEAVSFSATELPKRWHNLRRSVGTWGRRPTEPLHCPGTAMR